MTVYNKFTHIWVFRHIDSRNKECYVPLFVVSNILVFSAFILHLRIWRLLVRGIVHRLSFLCVNIDLIHLGFAQREAHNQPIIYLQELCSERGCYHNRQILRDIRMTHVIALKFKIDRVDGERCFFTVLKCGIFMLSQVLQVQQDMKIQCPLYQKYVLLACVLPYL